MAINRYETIIILYEHLTEMYALGVKDKLQKTLLKLIEEYTGKDFNPHSVCEFEGKKTLAYEVKGCKEGYYITFRFSTSHEAIIDWERMLRIDDDVIKFLTTRVMETDDAPSVKSEQEDDANKINKIKKIVPNLRDLLADDDYVPEEKEEEVPESESEQPSSPEEKEKVKPQVYVLYHRWEWDGERDTVIEIYATWEDALKKFEELKAHERGEFERFDKDSIEESERIDDIKKDFARFDIWNNNDGLYESYIKINKQEVK